MAYTPSTREIDRVIAVADLPWVHRARLVLMFCGGVYVLFGIALAPLMYLMFTLDPSMGESGWIFGLVMAVFTFGVCFVVGVANLLASRGLRKGARWGWVLALILGATYLPSGCFPFGAIVLYALLNEEVRQAYFG